MSQFADQQIGSLLQLRNQILRGANIARSYKFEAWRIETQAKGMKPLVTELFDQRIQVGGGHHPNIYAADVDLTAVFPGLKLEFKWDKTWADVRCVQPDGQWLN